MEIQQSMVEPNSEELLTSAYDKLNLSSLSEKDNTTSMSEKNPLYMGLPVESSTDGRKIFLGGLKYTENEDTVKEHFSRFGEVESVLIPRTKNTKRPRGFGFVTFKDPTVAQVLVDGIDPTSRYLGGRHIEIRMAEPRQQQQPEEGPVHDPLVFHDQVAADEGEQSEGVQKNRIFVGGLPDGVTNNTLKEYFNRFGTVIDSFVLLQPVTKRPRGFGFVTFKNKDVIPEVLAYDKHMINGKRVETRRATVRSNKPVAKPTWLNMQAQGFVNTPDPSSYSMLKPMPPGPPQTPQPPSPPAPANFGANAQGQVYLNYLQGVLATQQRNLSGMYLHQQQAGAAPNSSQLPFPPNLQYNMMNPMMQPSMQLPQFMAYNQPNMSSGDSIGNPFPTGMQMAGRIPSALGSEVAQKGQSSPDESHQTRFQGFPSMN
eukprot:maker-scaffold_6-snap-gene-9.29-mRNA-1 protein AED:0.01 eAED:0.01 QI:539/1/1/1/1/1/3/190/427